MTIKLRRIQSGEKQYNFPFSPGEEDLADAWLAKQRAKNGFLADDYTVEDIDNPDYVEPAELDERGKLDANKHKVARLVVLLARDINQASPDALSPNTKALAQELRALLRP